MQFNYFKNLWLLAGLGVLVAGALVLSLNQPLRRAVLGESEILPFLSTKPIDAGTINGHTIAYWLEANHPLDVATLNGQPGLYYLKAQNLTGVISTQIYSAYDDLVSEAKIQPESEIITKNQLDSILRQYQLTTDGKSPDQVITQSIINSVEAGIGLAGGGNSGDVRLNVVVGEGIMISNDKLTAVVGENISLMTEVVGVLNIANGGTGLSTAPTDGQFLIGDNGQYGNGSLTAGDGLELTIINDVYTYSLDNTVCRTSGNCVGSGGGIVGSGGAGQVAFFTDTSNISSSSGITWDSANNIFSVADTINADDGYIVNGQPLSTNHVVEGSALYWTNSRFDLRLATKTTDDITEGATNTYYSETLFNLSLATKTTDNLSQGSLNLYYSDNLVSANTDVAANTAARHNAIAISDSATLDLALVGQLISGSVIQSGLQTSLLNNDAGFITNLTSFDTDDLVEGTNLYYTSARFNTDFSSKSTSDLAEGTNLYYTQGRFDTAFGNKTTDQLTQGSTNLYSQWASFATGVSFADDVILGGTSAANGTFFFNASEASLSLGTNESLDGALVLYSSGASITDPSITTNANGDLVLSAPGGQVQVGNGDGDIELQLISPNDSINLSKSASASALVTDNDFVFSRDISAGVNDLDGVLVRIEDTSTSSGIIGPDMLFINANQTGGSYTGMLLRLQVGSLDTLTVDYAGNVVTAGQITAGDGLIVSNGIVDVPANSISDFEVSNTLTASKFNGSGSTTDALDLGTAEVSGTLAVANGGTSQTTIQAAINSLSGLTTAGDLLYHNGTNATRLARGTDGQCLTSSTTTLTWAACDSANIVTGSGVADRIAFWNGVNTQTGSGSLLWRETWKTLLVDNADGLIRVGSSGQGADFTTITNNYFGARNAFGSGQRIKIGYLEEYSKYGIMSKSEGGAYSGVCTSRLMMGASTETDSLLSLCDDALKLLVNSTTTDRAEIYSDHGLQFTSADNSAFTISGTSDLLLTGGGLQIGGGATMNAVLSGTAVWDPTSLATGEAASTTFTVTGAVIGDVVSVGFDQALPDGVLISGSVSAVGMVKVTIFNASTGAVDLPSGTVRAKVTQF